MSNLPPNPYVAGSPLNANAALLNHNTFNQLPSSQLPPGYGAVKQDSNSNSPLPPTFSPQNHVIAHGYSKSASNSPSFNHPGMVPYIGLPSSPIRPSTKPSTLISSNQEPVQNASIAARVSNANATPAYFARLVQQQINDNAPPLNTSSHQPLVNGPPPGQRRDIMSLMSQYPVASSAFDPQKPPVSASNFGPPMNLSFGQQGPAISKPSGQGLMNHPNVPLSGPPSSSPAIPGPPSSVPLSRPQMPPVSAPTISDPPLHLPNAGSAITGYPVMGQSTSSISGPSSIGPPLARTVGINGPSNLSGPPMSGQPMGFSKAPGLPSGPMVTPANAGSLSGPPTSQSYPGVYNNGPPGPRPPMPGPQGPPPLNQGQIRPMGPHMGPASLPPGPPSGPPITNMQGRYPQMPQTNYTNHQSPQHMANAYPQQYNTQGMTQQMGQLSVTKQGFDQLWGHQMVDLLTCKQILPEYPEEPPEIRLGHQFADSPNCSPEIFRCTINRIPETNSLLQKSRLPLGILIHPFKDLNHLPVIQCSSIVRCRACRTYINPFVYFVDAKRWKCNLCYRVNDLPEEFQYDPVSKSYGDPSRRPEIKSATIEFIAPGEYMLRPPQPAVYLFLMDVSQLARDSGYLQVACDTLKANLDQLPGDARTQVGFVCYDAHVHYYLMSDGLARPKEMTVIDIDDVFLPSPESLLVNLGERRELVKELLAVLPQRYSGPGQPASALGAALQAAYKLLAPTGGRITVFQTCLPNVGPGALEAREDPNARSSAEVAHLNPATDFYKRLALDCSGAQVAVDLFLLNGQYADMATLSGMSKFSGGSVYHVPLFRAGRAWHTEYLTRLLTRYLTRKIGFEAVMRVRCTRGISIHTFHGNFFVRSTDLLSLPNVSPDAAFGMQLSIEESLSDLQQVCFQAALLYTSSKGERRIRVHTLALPIATNLTDVLHSADQQAIIGLLSKMAADRCASASLGEAREALMNVAVDALSAYKLAQNLPAGSLSASLHAPASLRLLPLYLLALLKRRAFRTGTSTRLDDRVSDQCALKTAPLSQLLRAVYPDLYAVHDLRAHVPPGEDVPDPPRMHLSAERINSNGAYLLDDGDTMTIYVCHAASVAFLSDTFGVTAFSQLPDEARSLPRNAGDGNAILHTFIDKLNDDRPYIANILILRDNSPNRTLFTDRLVDDRVESAFAYYEFLQHIKTQVK